MTSLTGRAPRGPGASSRVPTSGPISRREDLRVAIRPGHGGPYRPEG